LEIIELDAAYYQIFVTTHDDLISSTNSMISKLLSNELTQDLPGNDVSLERHNVSLLFLKLLAPGVYLGNMKEGSI
jgi:hypothetical protein